MHFNCFIARAPNYRAFPRVSAASVRDLCFEVLGLPVGGYVGRLHFYLCCRFTSEQVLLPENEKFSFLRQAVILKCRSFPVQYPS